MCILGAPDLLSLLHTRQCIATSLPCTERSFSFPIRIPHNTPQTNDKQHMRDFSAALLAKVVELSPGMADVDNTGDDTLEMSQEMFFTVHLLYSGLCTSVDLFGLPQYPEGATYYGERTRSGYAVRRPRRATAQQWVCVCAAPGALPPALCKDQ